MSVSIQRYPIFDVASPLRDLIFYEVVDYNLQNNRNAEYGDPYHNTRTFPNHELVYIAPNDKEGKFYRFYYAAKRENQDEYNWKLSSGQQLIRTYLVPRNLYYERSADEAVDNFIVSNEFTYPEIGTLDTRFAKYGFADDTVEDAPQELSSLYIIVQRRFLEPVTNEISWDDTFKKNIRIKKELIPALLEHELPTQIAGKTIEIQKGNRFHDVRITKELIQGVGESYPYEKDPLPDYRDFKFPSRLDGIDLVWVWAWADSTSALPSYSEDFYFDWKITDPRPGPYSATIRRFITDDPESLKNDYPLTEVPAPVGETMAVVYAWFYASLDGNNTAAVANERQLPASIHGPITVTLNGTEPEPDRERVYTDSYPETPGYSAFMALSTIRIGYETRELPLSLYEVTIIEINISNLYGG
jgi:hypothetical protein